jgi:hypothetical protein
MSTVDFEFSENNNSTALHCSQIKSPFIYLSILL